MNTKDVDARLFATSFVLYTGIACLLVGAVSLSVAYLIGGPAWEAPFGTHASGRDAATSFWMELARLLLVVLLAFATLGIGFPRELHLLFSRRGSLAAAEYRRNIVFFRLAFVFCAALLAALKSYEVFDDSQDGAPAELIRTGIQFNRVSLEQANRFEIEETWERAVLGYVAYIPYAQVFYAIAFTLVLIVPLFAIMTTDRRASSRRKDRDHVRGSIAEVKKRFSDFRYTCYRQAMRYLNLYAAVALVFLFLQVDTAFRGGERIWIYGVFYVLSAAVAVFFMRIWVVYHNFWQEMSHFIESLDEDQRGYIEENAPLRLFQSMLKQPLPGFAIAGLALVLIRNYLPVFLQG